MLSLLPSLRSRAQAPHAGEELKKEVKKQISPYLLYAEVPARPVPAVSTFLSH